jgi:hypothetical protein
VVAAEVVPAAGVSAGGERVDPGDRTLESLLRIRVEREELLERTEADRLHLDERRGDRPQRHLRPRYEPGQAEAANCRLEPVGVLRRTAHDPRSVRAQELQPPDVAAEAARPVVVLAVDVVGDRAADGHVLGTGRDRKEPAARNDERENLVQTHAGLAGEQAGGGIERVEAVQTAGGEEDAPLVQTGIAIAAAESVGQRRSALGDGKRLVAPEDRHHLLERTRSPAP